MKLKQFSSKLGLSYSTALRMFKRGEIPGAFKLPSGTIIVPDDALLILQDSHSKRSFHEIYDECVKDLSGEKIKDLIAELQKHCQQNNLGEVDE